jgi:hypothetical protein
MTCFIRRSDKFGGRGETMAGTLGRRRRRRADKIKTELKIVEHEAME